MVKVCEEYADEFHVKFNGLKSKCLVFKRRGCQPSDSSVRINGVEIRNVQSAVHLDFRPSYLYTKL